MMDQHDTDGTATNTDTAKYAGGIVIVAILALVAIRVLVERK